MGNISGVGGFQLWCYSTWSEYKFMGFLGFKNNWSNKQSKHLPVYRFNVCVKPQLFVYREGAQGGFNDYFHIKCYIGKLHPFNTIAPTFRIARSKRSVWQSISYRWGVAKDGPAASLHIQKNWDFMADDSNQYNNRSLQGQRQPRKCQQYQIQLSNIKKKRLRLHWWQLLSASEHFACVAFSPKLNWNSYAGWSCPFTISTFDYSIEMRSGSTWKQIQTTTDTTYLVQNNVLENSCFESAFLVKTVLFLPITFCIPTKSQWTWVSTVVDLTPY